MTTPNAPASHSEPVADALREALDATGNLVADQVELYLLEKRTEAKAQARKALRLAFAGAIAIFGMLLWIGALIFALIPVLGIVGTLSAVGFGLLVIAAILVVRVRGAEERMERAVNV